MKVYLVIFQAHKLSSLLDQQEQALGQLGQRRNYEAAQGVDAPMNEYDAAQGILSLLSYGSLFCLKFSRVLTLCISFSGQGNIPSVKFSTSLVWR